MSWFDTYWAGLKAVIHATFPEVPAGALALDTSAERRDWINLLNAGQLTSPWVIVKIDISDSDFGPVDALTYQAIATINYIALTNTPATVAGAPTPPLTITEYLAGKQIALANAFLSATGLGTGLGTVLTSAPISINSDNPITVVLLDAKLPFQAASVMVTSIIIDPGA